MTTKEVADRYFQLAQKGQNQTIIDELYSGHIVSVEPENDSGVPRETRGKEEYREKERKFYDMIEKMFGGFCEPPIVSTFHFACLMGMDVVMKGKERKMKKEIGVFEVRDGKIVQEKWFYDDFF